MYEKTWLKSCNVIVLPEENNSYRLWARDTGQSFILDHTQAAAWFDGDVNRLGNLKDDMREAGLIRESDKASLNPNLLDDLKPLLVQQWLRFYSESPELTILFNTRSMPENNPLLVLGPYGTVIWRAIINGEKIGQIRSRVLRLFGADEVLPFLARLMRLGFLMPLKQVLDLLLGEEKIIKEFHTPEVQFMIPHSRIPWYCIWEISTICDTRCQICYLQDYQKPGPQGAELDKLIEQIDRMGIFYVTLLGGEAMLRPDLEDVIARLRRSDIFVKLITNGNLLTPERARMLAQANLNHIEISFDGLTAHSHEQSRAPGTFRKAEKAVRFAQDSGIPRVGMVFTLYSQNVGDLPHLPEFMKNQRINECYISLFHKTGLMGSKSAIKPLPAEMLSQVYRLVKQWESRDPGLTITLLPLCTCGHTSAVISADMTLRPCTFSYESSVGNLTHNSLANLWSRLGERPRIDTVWCQNS
jgi:MoaA/NifB/PqqE/SkfB family radical SAM enzyme